MNKSFINAGYGLALSLAFSTAAFAQDTIQKTTTTETRVVQNADGTYSVIEYPVGKEVTVTLNPDSIAGATGTAQVLRAADSTRIHLDLAGVSGDTSSFYAYAVDSSGMPTLLGPVLVENGMAKTDFSTPLNRFMLVLSPTEGLKTFDSSTAVSFRSTVPTGYAVIPVSTMNNGVNNEKQSAVTGAVSSPYQVPLLNVPSFDKRTTEIRIKFDGDLKGLKGKAYIEPLKDGTAKIKMRFDDMKMAPKDKRYILWASSADGKYTKIGQVVNTGERQESEIRGETAMQDFGLFVTMEDSDVNNPTSKSYTVFTVGQ